MKITDTHKRPCGLDISVSLYHSRSFDSYRDELNDWLTLEGLWERLNEITHIHIAPLPEGSSITISYLSRDREGKTYLGPDGKHLAGYSEVHECSQPLPRAVLKFLIDGRHWETYGYSNPLPPGHRLQQRKPGQHWSTQYFDPEEIRHFGP